MKILEVSTENQRFTLIFNDRSTVTINTTPPTSDRLWQSMTDTIKREVTFQSYEITPTRITLKNVTSNNRQQFLDRSDLSFSLVPSKNPDDRLCQIFLDTTAPDADLSPKSPPKPIKAHPEMTLTNPNHIQTYSSQPLQVEAFQYWYPLTNSQRLWLGNYFIDQPQRRVGEPGAMLIQESLISESALTIYVLSGSYVILYPSGRLRAVSKEKFQEEFTNYQGSLT